MQQAFCKIAGFDNKNYFLVAKNLLTWMKSTFGTPTGSNHLTESQGGVHGDMFFYGNCDDGCYFNATGGVSEIFFRELP